MRWRSRAGTVRAVFFAFLTGWMLYSAVTVSGLAWLTLPLALFTSGMTVNGLALRRARRTQEAATDPRVIRLMRAHWTLYGLAGVVVLVEALAMMSWVPALLTAFAAFCWVWTCGWAVWLLRSRTPRPA